MPAIRAHKPLRERCNIQLRVKTTIPHDVYDNYDLSSNSPAPRRGRTTTRKPIIMQNSKRVLRQTSKFKSTGESVPQLHPIHTPTAEGLPNLHRLVPYTYVGFHKGRFLPYSMVSSKGSLFTHVVKITHPSNFWQPGECDLQIDIKRGLLLLDLIVPASDILRDEADVNEEERTKTILTEHQLLVARDFLALALPYYAEAHPRLAAYNSRSSDCVRVLITAPEGKGGAADVMSIVACYLAWASEQPAGTVVEYIKAEEEVPTIWRDVVRGNEAVGLIEQVARLE
ncbi:hypothetical protein C0995_004293 [Termitomyces sp. Mi166|nr:hypothetical protein C0995_004293 [Termitomyces sp. Mi166\